MRPSLAAVALGGILAWVPVAAAVPGSQIGAAVRVVNHVTGDLNSTVRPLATGDGVLQDEAIEAEPDALAELRLNDDSKLAVGPGARLVLDKFIYNPEAGKGAVGVNLLKGAFRFITGLANKKDYLIRTPSAAITVRGTVFDVYVDASGGTLILLHEGALTVCNLGGQCTRLENPCGVVQIPGGGDPKAFRGWNQLDAPGRVDFALAFPFVVTPPSIDPAPRFTRVAVETGSCPQPPGGGPQPTQRAEAEPHHAPAPYTPAPRPAPGPAPAATLVSGGGPERQPWGGFYVGITAGAVWQRSDPDLDCNDYTAGTVVCSTLASFNIPRSAYDTDDRGILAGGQAGYNLTFGNVVAGLEADIAYTDIDVRSRYDQVFVFPCCTIVRGSSVHQELKALSTVRARLGYAFDNVLVYATGGLAVGQVEYGFDVDWPDIGGVAHDSTSKLEVGYTGGAGVEIALGAWSLKTEYLYYDLGSETLTAPFYLSGVRQPFDFKPRFETDGHIVRIGANFHFN